MKGFLLEVRPFFQRSSGTGHGWGARLKAPANACELRSLSDHRSRRFAALHYLNPPLMSRNILTAASRRGRPKTRLSRAAGRPDMRVAPPAASHLFPDGGAAPPRLPRSRQKTSGRPLPASRGRGIKHRAAPLHVTEPGQKNRRRAAVAFLTHSGWPGRSGIRIAHGRSFHGGEFSARAAPARQRSPARPVPAPVPPRSQRPGRPRLDKSRV